MDIDILSLFPEYFETPFSCSLLQRAREAGLLRIQTIDIRQFSKDKRRSVDDSPYGGGPGMVLKVQPVVDAIRSVRREHTRVIYLSPQGSLLTAKRCEQFAKECDHIVLLCGHYEGVDQRAIDLEVDEEVSIGDYVLTSGMPAALVFVDAVSRFVEGVVGDFDSVYQDSFHQEEGFDAPCYTRPPVFEERNVPEVLINGHHKEIDQWRKNEAKKKRERVRPDLEICK